MQEVLLVGLVGLKTEYCLARKPWRLALRIGVTGAAARVWLSLEDSGPVLAAILCSELDMRS